MNETTLPATPAEERPAARPRIQGIRGMNDVLPEQSARWERLEDTVREVFAQYGYAGIRVPIVEQTDLFVRGVGEVTDIVEKEMYTFTDSLNGESLTLRPEATSGIVRSAIEHSLVYAGPIRVWTAGPMFRHERPQKGRYRQFHQFDAEALGFPGPDVDAEQIVMLARLWKRLGIDNVRLEINSIGDAEERRRHRELLIAHFERHGDLLDEDARRRLFTNPLRILDSKNAAMRPVIESAPKLIDLLGGETRAHFEGLRRLLDAAGVAYAINPRLVRGLDYYNRTVFEWVSADLGAQGTIAGGGRYDGLFAQLGGRPAPGCGFAIGAERVILLLEQRGLAPRPAPDAYVVHVGEAALAVALAAAERLRDAGRSVVVNAGGGSFKTQMKRADSSGARMAVIVGDDEALAGEVSVKPLREAGEQRRLPIEHVDRACAPGGA
jgi:histidyl-tRNA synthetase